MESDSESVCSDTSIADLIGEMDLLVAQVEASHNVFQDAIDTMERIQQAANQEEEGLMVVHEGERCSVEELIEQFHIAAMKEIEETGESSFTQKLMSLQ
jgi:hypothetical protein